MNNKKQIIINEEKLTKLVTKIVNESIKKILKEETWQTALQRNDRKRAQNLFAKKYNFKNNKYRDEEPIDGIDTVSDVSLDTNTAGAGRTTKFKDDPNHKTLSTDKFFSRDGVTTNTYNGGVPNDEFEWDDELNDYYSGDWADRMNKKRKQLGNYGLKGLDKPLHRPKLLHGKNKK